MYREPSKQLIDLFRGWPNPALLPVTSLTQATSTALSTPSIYQPGLQYGPDEGHPPLRQHIADWLTSFYRPKDPVSTARICISGGASQNLACVLQVFTDAAYTRNVWMVAPTYYLACGIFHDAGFMNRLRGVPEDAEGIDIGFLEKALQEAEAKATAEGNHKPLYTLARPWSKIYKHIIYLTSTFANPSMKVVSTHRREQLIRLARQYDALIISDDVYDFLQWPSDPNADLSTVELASVPRLVDIDRYLDGGPIDVFGNAMSNGSFSKLVGPGVRTGWVEGTEKFAYGVSQTGSSVSGGAPSQLTATFVDHLVSTGALQRHIKSKLIPSYRARYQQVLSAIDDNLVPLGFQVAARTQLVVGGYFIWLDLPPSIKASVLTERALAEENVRIGSGALFKVQGDASDHHQDFEGSVRLCFAWEEFDQLYEGVRRLGNTARSILNKR
ncbi:putative aminotransferase [Talaromyces proteolyticus]|uniref:Aminotransferase n=1 Tax=Talaromyces proteolyticus TaxID=1131652 RepID=A0AAD4KXH6_9EURO|nr:putative aminotransferase [Talaromyces proteolyticus]KAH8698977.1 putative aminotransferase [Talaromyces proteolyticus]